MSTSGVSKCCMRKAPACGSLAASDVRATKVADMRDEDRCITLLKIHSTLRVCEAKMSAKFFCMVT